ncbi:MAG: adenine-specific methyltransferase EcoRI family protein [Treponemataceae bacterium]|nr:adenine-specific methyltransferase EcoRI family protein [Spirochaetales bacterium]MDY6030999.1 adenine-specific methyltransferase EcoRI family protein [Treponemataceae bacterium]
MANTNLGKAKAAKNDEFYTQYADIQNEINAYIDYNPDVFKDKTILLPCDDPEWSNFTKFFVNNFERYGIKKLISTSYAYNSKKVSFDYQPTLFETIDSRFEIAKSKERGKIFTLTKDENNDGKIDEKDLKWEYLEGDGDFRSDEIKKLRDEADIIITNPPFSLFREFVAWIFDAKKSFAVIGNMNAITYKEIFPLIKNNQMWLDNPFVRGAGYFTSPLELDKTLSYFNSHDYREGFIRVSGVRWFTNLEHGKRHQPLKLMTESDNIKFSKHKEVKGLGYLKYDNYDAIEIPFTDSIPSNYKGMMGVPISFLDKYCPEQFEIIGLLQSSTDEQAGIPNLRYYNDFKEMRQDMTYTGSSGGKANGNPVLKGKSEKGNFLYNPITEEYVHSVYARILIRHKEN